MGDRAVLTTCPRDCYDACGIQVAVREDGTIRHVRGDPHHPVSRGRLCAKCTAAYNGVFLDPRARLTTPLIHGRPASWDQALAHVADRLTAIVADPPAGSASILNAHYTGTDAVLGYGYGQRFMRTLGAREVDPDTICNKAGHVALGYLYGTSEDGFDPRTAEQAKCILVWGANPSTSAPHQDEHWLAEAPGRIVVVDPIRTGTAARADLHLQPFPGSDAALAFALAHVIVRDGLQDPEILARHALGWEELEPVIARCPPDWGQRVTGVPAADIERAAHTYGAGPSLLWLGQGFQRQPRGGNAIRAVAQLAAISGNLGRPGAGLLYLNGSDSRGIDSDYVTAAGLPDNSPDPISHMELVEWLADPARTRALIAWNINLAASNPRQRELRRALQRDDLFTVAIDIFPTDTTDLADVVLPAASFLECDDLVTSYFDLTLSAQVKITEPPGDALPNPEIFRRLARALGMTHPALQESDRDLIDHLLQRTGLHLTFEQLAARGTVPVSTEPHTQFDDMRFPTPSGCIELASDRAQRDGHPRLAEPHADPRPPAGHLRLLSPASPWSLNASFANEPKLDGRRGPATLTLHPADAAAAGLRAGDAAVVRSTTGELTLTVALSEDLPVGVALSPKGRWPRRDPQGATVNVLNPGIPADMGASTSVHGIEVTVARAPTRA
ncbi:MAG TPA: molybdopterin-dependent oxidoreductase [Solirubrobacteraceae bacterium]|jgi:anaerobic selenocysteine-containing dehydrogenase